MGTVNQIYPKDHERWLPDEALLWRYVPLKTLLVYLTGNIFIPSVATLKRADPFEGGFHFTTELFNSAMIKKYGARVSEIEDWIYRNFSSETDRRNVERNEDSVNCSSRVVQKHYFDFLRKTRYAWCWFHSDRESAAMWSNYGKAGVAISTTVGKLRAMLGNSGRNFAFGKMRYLRMIDDKVIDFRHQGEDADFLLRPYFLKREEYGSENEVRFVTAAPESPGILLKNINPSNWIKEILLWPGLNPSEEGALQDIVSHFKLNAPCKCSGLLGAKEPSTATVALAPLDVAKQNQWKDGADEIPTELKQL